MDGMNRRYMKVHPRDGFSPPDPRRAIGLELVGSIDEERVLVLADEPVFPREHDVADRDAWPDRKMRRPTSS
jgi:hypothetical protein